MLKDCLIIGGGMSGLIAAKTLENHGLTVTILDKGRGIGGRLATRRLTHPHYGEGVIDYGAPHFTVDSTIFETIVKEWLDQGIVKIWSEGFKPGDEKTYYCGTQSNRSIAKYLAQNLEVYTSTKVEKIEWRGQYWQVYTETGNNFTSKQILLTCPIPQTVAILDNSHISIESEIRTKLTQVSYHPCIAVLALLSGSSQVPTPGGLWLEDSSLKWISCNHQKGISPLGYGVTLYATPEYSQSHWESKEEEIVKDLFTIASPWLKSEVVAYQVHRWRYSQANKVYGEPFLSIEESGKLVLAGDGFMGFGVEGAVLSGLRAAEYIIGVHARQ